MTPERFAKIRSVLDRRQPDLTILLDNVHKPHNFSAIVRTCDAVGILEAHAVWPDPELRPHHDSASGTGRWVTTRVHRTLEGGFDYLRRRGFRIFAAHFSRRAKHYRDVDYIGPAAILLGAELQGISPQGSDLSDEHIVIPLFGMVQSLNVSVAAATILFEAQRQREVAGLYNESRLDPDLYARTLFEWTHPQIAAHCKKKRIPYPGLDANGDIVEPLPY